MNPDILTGAAFNGLLVGVVGWLINDKLKNMTATAAERYEAISGRIERIEGAFFKNTVRCDHDEK